MRASAQFLIALVTCFNILLLLHYVTRAQDFNNPFTGPYNPGGYGGYGGDPRAMMYGPRQPSQPLPAVRSSTRLQPPPDVAPPQSLQPLPWITDISMNRSTLHSDHHTELYRGEDDTTASLDMLIIRRGQPFSLQCILKHNSNFIGNRTSPIVLGFRFKSTNAINRRLLSNLPFIDVPIRKEAPREDSSSPGTPYSLKSNKLLESEHYYELRFPDDAHVGFFQTEVVVASSDENFENSIVFELPSSLKIAVLFNPWNRNDQVHIEDEHARKEYVLNEQGMAWGGSEQWRVPMPWLHEHLSSAVFQVSLRFLDYSPNFDDRKDAAKMSRLLSALTNANDENGLVVGKWEYPYWDGVAPESWGGSFNIFNRFRQYGSPFLSGSCVARILCSAARALGLPARIITNYNSAHEEGRNGKYRNEIDVFFSYNGMPLQTPSKWVEVFLHRNLSNVGMNGWQVVDGTPQELSTESGLYQVGPAAVQQVKEGRVSAFDTDFVISEVNSIVNKYDAVPHKKLGFSTNKFLSYYPYPTGGPMHPERPGFFLLSRMSGTVGKTLLTKNLSNFHWFDITENYKVLRKPASASTLKPVETESLPAAFSVSTSWPSRASFGSDFNLSIVVHCPQCSLESPRKFDILLSMDIVTSTATIIVNLAQQSNEYLLKHEATTFVWVIKAEAITRHFQPMTAISIAVAVVDQSDTSKPLQERSWRQSESVPIWIPPPTVECKPLSSRSFLINATVTNPLQTELKEAALLVSGAFIERQLVELKTFAGNETRTVTTVVSLRKGRNLEGKESLVTLKLIAEKFESTNALLLVSS